MVTTARELLEIQNVLAHRNAASTGDPTKLYVERDQKTGVLRGVRAEAGEADMAVRVSRYQLLLEKAPKLQKVKASELRPHYRNVEKLRSDVRAFRAKLLDSAQAQHTLVRS